MLKICTVYFEGLYKPEDVSKLYRSLKKHSSVPFDFICLSDTNVEVDVVLPYNHHSNIKKHWHKLKYFSPQFAYQNLGDDIIVMDIDQRIVGNVDDILNFPISKIILEGPADQLQLTKNTQPAILTVSYSIFKVLKEEFNFKKNDINFFAGHSLGEYSALVCSNALNFSDAIYLLHERGKAMQEAVPVGKGSMIAVLGTKIEEINSLIKLIDSKKGICEIANDNAEGQVIVSGDKEIVQILQLKLKEKKIKSIPLKVSAPFHCSLMKPAAEIMVEKI